MQLLGEVAAYFFVAQAVYHSGVAVPEPQDAHGEAVVLPVRLQVGRAQVRVALVAPVGGGRVLGDGLVNLPQEADVFPRDCVVLRGEDEQLVPPVLPKVVLGGNSIKKVLA